MANPTSPTPAVPPRVGLVTSEVFLEHVTDAAGHPEPHPESPRRLKAIMTGLERAELLHRLDVFAPREATDTHLCLVHEPAMIERVERLAREGGGLIDADTVVSPASARVARLAAGGGTLAVDRVMGGKVDRVFLPVRPPGHHATSTRSMGFCLFNNAAVAAAFAIEEHGLHRVAIVDIDVHHGNGTQEIFYGRSDVFYVSLHQYPLYPGTGSAAETGEGAGRGATLNIPLWAGTSEGVYLEKVHKVVVPALDRYEPQILMISIGFDSHRDDPLGSLALTAWGYGQITEDLVGVARRHALGRVISFLEGGYNLEAVAESAAAHVRALLV